MSFSFIIDAENEIQEMNQTSLLTPPCDGVNSSSTIEYQGIEVEEILDDDDVMDIEEVEKPVPVQVPVVVETDNQLDDMKDSDKF